MQLRTLSFIVLLATCNIAKSELQLHVSPTGDDNANGSINSPLATIAGARDRIRSLRETDDVPTGLIEVLIHAGHYPQSQTLVWTDLDSGSEQAPIIYRSIDGDVVLSGGAVIQHWEKLVNSELLDRLPDAARVNVVFTQLNSIGVSAGELGSRRLHQEMNPEPAELFLNNQRLPRASWPNQEWAKTVRDGNMHTPRTWTLERYIHASDAPNAWAHGFWEYDWRDSFEPIQANNNSEWITISEDAQSSPKHVRAGARYRLCNLLAELDSPGEWYIDAESQSLVYWPIEPTDSTQEVSVSCVETLLSLYDLEHVSFEGIRIETARSMLVEVVGGSHVCFKDCVMSQAGNTAVHFFRGENHRLLECDISCTGSSAVRIEGGDRASLTPCNHLIENCHVHNFGELFLAGRAGISIYGVGAKISQNHIHSGPDVAIEIHGNEHTLEHNEISHVCTMTDDSAAIRLAYDPTYRGNVIRKNHIHDLGGFSTTGVIGIYLDDFASGTVVESNYLVNTVRGIAIGGGRDNRIENNVIDGALAAIQIDARGTTWSKSHVQGEESRIQKLCRTTITELPVYAERYPELTQMLQDQPEQPKGNTIRSNVFRTSIGIDLQQVNPEYVVLDGNLKQTGSKFDSEEAALAKLGIRARNGASPTNSLVPSGKLVGNSAP